MNNYVVSDQELISLYLQGCQSSLEDLINRHKSRIFSYILTVVKDKPLAEDLFQDTFMKIINTFRSGNYKEEGKFIHWAMRIAHNLIIDFYRKQKRFPVVPNSDDFDIFETLNLLEKTVEDRIITDQIHRDVRKLIDYLPDEQKEVLVMRHYSNMSFKDIAEVTDVSINTALGRMRYALINLRKLIQEKEVILTQ
ncbi:MAG: sigma-70 family RNA polymerase sigma factor [Bacteroidales bacterium]|nr:sigma-70 family RNA polymerase sigma factor [Bacteroidales bacterium]